MSDHAQNRKIYDFKSVGEIDLEVADREIQDRIFKQKKPIGIKTPLQLSDNADSLFAMNTSRFDQISDNLRNLIQTKITSKLLLRKLRIK